MGIKYQVNEAFFDKWSHPMAYILGFWYADGSLEDAPYIRGKYIRVTSTDKSIVELIKDNLQADHSITLLKPNNDRVKPRYLMRIGSQRLFKSLTKKGLHPYKSLTMTFPKIPKKYLTSFVRGYFDGDGCIYLEKGKGANSQVILKRLRLIFTSGSSVFLEGLSEALAKYLKIKKEYVRKSHRSFQLIYPTKDSIKLFVLFYGAAEEPLYLKRKFEIFRQYFTLRPIRVSAEIKEILNRA